MSKHHHQLSLLFFIKKKLLLIKNISKEKQRRNLHLNRMKNWILIFRHLKLLIVLNFWVNHAFNKQLIIFKLITVKKKKKKKTIFFLMNFLCSCYSTWNVSILQSIINLKAGKYQKLVQCFIIMIIYLFLFQIIFIIEGKKL